MTNSKIGKGDGKGAGEAEMPPGLPKGLHIVATPIGNLRDITLRALDVLGGCDRLLAEDTRRTGQLLKAYGLEARMVSYHDHNADARVPQVLDWLTAGEAIALVSDAGTPLVSDPGFKLVRAAREAGHPVHAVPGASALTAALSVAGLPTDQFHFAGFLPAKRGARRSALEALREVPGTLVLYETGPRLADMLSDCAEVLGEREARVARELTKTFEEVRSGTLSALVPEVTPKGEIVVLIAPGEAAEWTEAEVDAALSSRAHLSVKDASREVAKLSGLPKRELYARAQELRDGGDARGG